MKWAKLVDDPERAVKTATPEQKVCFRYIGQKDLDKSFGVWMHYKFPPNFKLNARARKDYELFCGGFLLFYDDVVRNGVVDHAMYVKWEKRDKQADEHSKDPIVYDSVMVMLSPAPQRRAASQYSSQNVMSQSSSAVEQHQEAMPAPAPGPMDDGIDPPSPPPPPPPSMDGTGG